MPPRVPGASAPLAAALGKPPTRTASVVSVRAFSTTHPQQRMSQRRIRMWTWMRSRGMKDYETSGVEVKYAGSRKDQPFPLNPLFKSEPVLSEQMRNAIWKKVVEDGEAIKAVSQEYGVDVRRIAAVVRLKEVENSMVDKVSSPPLFWFPSAFA